MKRTALMLALTLVTGIAIGVLSSRALDAQPSPIKSTELLKSGVAGLDGMEVVVQFSEFAPRASSGKHTHPGPEVAYVLQGSGVSEVEGQAPVTRKAGTVGYIEGGKVHESINESATEPLKLLVFRIHPKGKPITDSRLTEPHIAK